MVFDSRDHAFDPQNTILPSRAWDGDPAGGKARRTVEVEGVLFAAALDFRDGRKPWGDLLSAFATAHRDNPDAVLLLELHEADARWPQALYRVLALLPPFACRILAMRGSLEGADREALIAACHWWVSAANAEGLCLPMQDFLAAGRPAIAPAHTALADHLDAANALLVASDEEAWPWPEEGLDEPWSWTQHPDDVGPTTRHRLSWPSLVAAFAQAGRLAAAEPQAYARLCVAAAERMRAACGEAAAAAALAAFLAQEGWSGPPAPSPSALIRDLAAG